MPAESDVNSREAIKRLTALLAVANVNAAADSWDEIRKFFAAHAEHLPESLRREFLEMHTGLYGEQSDPSPTPLTPEEKLKRLAMVLWRMQKRP
jgi:hypothetical protein